MTDYLKCDAPGCSHRETVPRILETDIGKPCPLCGANLLTREDYAAWTAVVAPAIRHAKFLGMVEDADPTDPRRVSINWHEGELRVRTPQPDPDDDLNV